MTKKNNEADSLLDDSDLFEKMNKLGKENKNNIDQIIDKIKNGQDDDK